MHGYAQGVWLGIILVIIICLVNFVPKNEKKFEIGALSPDFAVKLNGSDEDIFTLSDAEGKVTVLNLWASWCSPCVEELPLLQKAYEERDINFVAVHYGEPDTRAETLMTQYSIPFAVDEDGSFASLFGDAQLLPQTVVIDADGTVLSIHVGSIDEGFTEENALPKSLTSYTVKVTDTDGNGISGVKLSVCRGDVCRLLMTDAAGMAVFEDEYGEYEVELLIVPEGYTAPQTAYILDSAELTLILNE